MVIHFRFMFLLVAMSAGMGSWSGCMTNATADDATSIAVQPYLLQMIRDDSVHRELKLTPDQINQVYAALKEVDPRWWVNRIAPLEKQQTEIRELTRMLKTKLVGVLSGDQIRRLKQLEHQAAGTRFVLHPEAAAKLELTETQKTRLVETFQKTDQDVAEIQKLVMEKEIDPATGAQDVAAIQAREQRSLVSQLTRDQQMKIGSLVGETFSFAGVKRQYPRAPEFVTEGSQWIQGEPTTMPELRGKVVVVYFYAFQCINCQRNFPHYEAWHEDMADKGVVVIGIQTPETSAERSLERVTAAVENDGFKYPVLFDEASGNWKAWGNTMWPTTYLIDKKGFIRRWWQGEMNWQGTPGEKQMRQTIEELIAE